MGAVQGFYHDDISLSTNLHQICITQICITNLHPNLHPAWIFVSRDYLMML
jgi:hypothetical protein